MSHRPSDPLLNAESSAAEVELSLPAFWKAVASRRLPAPFYPAPRAPRWRRSELLAALEATRALPAEAKASRRKAMLAKACESRNGEKAAPAADAAHGGVAHHPHLRALS